MLRYSKEQGKELLEFAREILKKSFENEIVKIPDKIFFKQARGVFVTLYVKGKLRGCIGFPNPSFSLGQAIVKAVCASAFEDNRFDKLKKEEMKDLKIEISVLTEPSLIDGNPALEIEIGKHGIICEYLAYRGLLLPQVAVQNNLDKISFLEAVCEKAGLPKDFWQNKNTKFYKFEAQVFREE